MIRFAIFTLIILVTYRRTDCHWLYAQQCLLFVMLPKLGRNIVAKRNQLNCP